ncbi:SRPBCC family protein [Streptacidiphilus sp. 4-A2]|nr:SRPBCC family protein [Streptacidiphilus sp. 4-A2]
MADRDTSTTRTGLVREAAVFQLRAEIVLPAEPSDIYPVISDLARSGEWSPECRGGSWVDGRPSALGAVFRGDNLRGPEVVPWAPVTRGNWSTYAEVVAAEPGRTFRWAMRDSAGARQDSVWGFDIEAAGEHSRLIHHFRMGEPTEGIRRITSGMTEEERRTFFGEWSRKLADDLVFTLGRIRDAIGRF